MLKLLVKFQKHKIDLVGFHGQTIYHNSEEKISVQLVMETYYQN